ncbi:MAG TPA: oxidoreductase, partial [Phycicoccus sp.]|nr:oxidoreductase [Phycicoccus sp.]HQK32913.1 oxidoreductase [Phycicoccus sp.]
MTERPHANPWPYAVSGLLAAAAGMAVGHLVAAWTDPATSPVLAVGSRVIDASPPALKDWAVSTLGTADKPVLLGSVAIVTGALAAAIGVLARRRRQLALFALTALAAVAG